MWPTLFFIITTMFFCQAVRLRCRVISWPTPVVQSPAWGPPIPKPTSSPSRPQTWPPGTLSSSKHTHFVNLKNIFVLKLINNECEKSVIGWLNRSGTNGIDGSEMFTWSRRTHMEKLLIGVVVVLAAAFVAVVAVAGSSR